MNMKNLISLLLGVKSDLLKVTQHYTAAAATASSNNMHV